MGIPAEPRVAEIINSITPTAFYTSPASLQTLISSTTSPTLSTQSAPSMLSKLAEIEYVKTLPKVPSPFLSKSVSSQSLLSSIDKVGVTFNRKQNFPYSRTPVNNSVRDLYPLSQEISLSKPKESVAPVAFPGITKDCKKEVELVAFIAERPCMVVSDIIEPDLQKIGRTDLVNGMPRLVWKNGKGDYKKLLESIAEPLRAEESSNLMISDIQEYRFVESLCAAWDQDVFQNDAVDNISVYESSAWFADV